MGSVYGGANYQREKLCHEMLLLLSMKPLVHGIKVVERVLTVRFCKVVIVSKMHFFGGHDRWIIDLEKVTRGVAY